MSKIELRIGDIVAETYEGHYGHREHHGNHSIKGAWAGIPLKFMIRRPRFLWRPRKGEVIEVQSRWWYQDGYDVKIKWRSGGEPEWRLADTEHLSVVKRASQSSEEFEN